MLNLEFKLDIHMAFIMVKAFKKRVNFRPECLSILELSVLATIEYFHP